MREKLLETVHDQRDMLLKPSHESRAAFVKQTFDSMVRKWRMKEGKMARARRKLAREW